MKTRTPKIEAHFKLLLSALAAALIAISPVQTWANTIALSFTTVTNPGGISPVTSGWSFSLTTTVTVTDLGVWDGAAGVTTETGGGDGLSDSHLVTIWTSTMVQVAQATVPAGSAATLTDGFRYVTLSTSVPLLPGDYVIGAYYQTANDFVASNANGITTATGVTYTGGRIVGGNAFPTFVDGSDGNFGPNFQFTQPTNGVPDSGSTILLLLGTVGALIAVRSKLAT